MPKIKVLSASPAPGPSKNGPPYYLTFNIACDTVNLTSSSFSVTCDLAVSPSTPVPPTNIVVKPPASSTADLVFQTTANEPAGTGYTLTIVNPSAWEFDNDSARTSGTTNSAGSVDQVVGPQFEKKRRSFGQRMLDFFRRLFG